MKQLRFIEMVNSYVLQELKGPHVTEYIWPYISKELLVSNDSATYLSHAME